MTEQSCCTLCGAVGHLAAQCNWNASGALESIRLPKHGTTIALDEVLAGYPPDDREDMREIIEAYADIQARKAVMLFSGAGLASHHSVEANDMVQAERAQFESWVRREWPGAPLHHVRDALPVSDPRYGEYCNENIQRGWVGWQARAALAQPSMVPELERPEVVAWSAERYVAGDHYSKPRLSFEQPFSTDRNIEPLMTVSQHDRIGMQWASLLHSVQANADAAQARVAELEKQEPFAFYYHGEPGYTALHLAGMPEPAGKGFERIFRKLPLYAAPVAQAGQVPEWISCEDQMPPANENVLVSYEFTSNDWRIKVGGVDERGNWWVFGASWTPSHWQPLPAAPAQGE